MTSMQKPDGTADLVAAVGGLRAAIERNEEAVRELALQTEQNRQANRHNRFAILLTVLTLALDLVVTGVLYDVWSKQDCRNHITAAFLDAEKAKVTGQVKGIRMIKAGQGRAGFDQFDAASEHYLVAIAKIPRGC